jgi:hypothetical protein
MYDENYNFTYINIYLLVEGLAFIIHQSSRTLRLLNYLTMNVVRITSSADVASTWHVYDKIKYDNCHTNMTIVSNLKDKFSY